MIDRTWATLNASIISFISRDCSAIGASVIPIPLMSITSRPSL
jgi:hypothetical protein